MSTNSDASMAYHQPAPTAYGAEQTRGVPSVSLDADSHLDGVPSWPSTQDRRFEKDRSMSTHSQRLFAIAAALALCSAVFVGCTTTAPDGRTGVASSKATIDQQSDAALS